MCLPFRQVRERHTKFLVHHLYLFIYLAGDCRTIAEGFSESKHFAVCYCRGNGNERQYTQLSKTAFACLYYKLRIVCRLLAGNRWFAYLYFVLNHLVKKKKSLSETPFILHFYILHTLILYFP